MTGKESLCACGPGEACSTDPCSGTPKADGGYEGPLRVKKASKERVIFHVPGCRAFVDGECDKDCVSVWWERQRG